MFKLLTLPPLTDWLLWFGSPIFLPIPIALSCGMVGYLVLMMFGLTRWHHVGGFVVFFGCLLCASSLTAFLLSEVPSARDEAFVKMASTDPPMTSWVTYYLDDHHITWLEAGVLHIAYATLHPSRAVLEPEPDRNAQFIRALRVPRKEAGRPEEWVRGSDGHAGGWGGRNASLSSSIACPTPHQPRGGHASF